MPVLTRCLSLQDYISHSVFKFEDEISREFDFLSVAIRVKDKWANTSTKVRSRLSLVVLDSDVMQVMLQK